MAGVKRFSLITADEERDLALRFVETGDKDAAERLVTANLRFVTKVALEYKAYGLRILDLVQEGNLGLMHAVKKFDPSRGYRLITYAVWWIRAYIQAYILKQWSLVKIGTTQAQRKLFFKLKGATQRLAGTEPDLCSDERRVQLAESLGVREQDVSMMEMRMAARDFSLDKPLDTDGGETTHVEMLPCDRPGTFAKVFATESRAHLREDLRAALSGLNEREREIIMLRHLSDEPPTLREVGKRWGVSRERARQIEQNARNKIKRYLLKKSRVVADILPGVHPESLRPAPRTTRYAA